MTPSGTQRLLKSSAPRLLRSPRHKLSVQPPGSGHGHHTQALFPGSVGDRHSAAWGERKRRLSAPTERDSRSDPASEYGQVHDEGLIFFPPDSSMTRYQPGAG